VLWEGAGELRRLYEEIDWAATPVGPVASWTHALVEAVDIALHTQFPVCLFWGPEFVLIYNAAYVPLIADKHPSALGRPARDVFPEAWDAIGPMMQRVLAGEGATWLEDEAVPLYRFGRLKEAYFTFSYSPVRGRDGVIEGVMDIAVETTRQVVDRRRLETLSLLRDALDELDRVDDARDRIMSALKSNARDFSSVELVPSTTPAAGDAHRFPLGSDGQWTLLVPRSPELVEGPLYERYLRLVVSLLDRAVIRLEAREDEHAIATELQRSLLTRPLQPDHIQVAVRYQPAARRAEIGGDWYDAFLGPDGALALVVGDVTGHDQQAAAKMGQIRNLLRGVYYTLRGSPAATMAALDDALEGLAVRDFATAILARVEQDRHDAARGVRTLRWTNAGHPPPVLIDSAGHARLLETPPEPLLGLAFGDRNDHTVELEPGATVVFYTDGLIEVRDQSLSVRLEWLVDLLQDSQRLDAERLCDHILDRVAHADDDIALVVMRVHPEDRRRPPEAGPEVLPPDLGP
jgi:hypothetical protein